MKNKKSISSVILVFMILIVFAFCGKQKPEWGGTIEEVDGVTVVKNPKEPIYGEGIFGLKDELTIGKKKGEEEYMFTRLIAIDVDEEGNIYTLDLREGHIKAFDNNGKYIKTIGKKGQGPGEMQMPYNIHITPKKEILVNDARARRLLFFSLDGTFLRQISTAKMTFFVYPKMNSKGMIVGSKQIPGGLIPGFELLMFDSNFDLIKTISKIELPKPPIIEPEIPEFCWEYTQEDNLIWGIPTKYELHVLNMEGEIIKKIKKDYDPVRVTEEEKEVMKKRFSMEGAPPNIKFEFPQNHLAFVNLSIDDEGRIFIGTYEKIENGEGYYYDVFDSEGKYLAKIPLKLEPQVWKKGNLYTIEEDDEGFQVVKRYKVTWSY